VKKSTEESLAFSSARVPRAELKLKEPAGGGRYKHIAVVGLGQIGGSIVLSLRKNHAPYQITGIDTSAKRLRLMKPHLDSASAKWDAAKDSDIIVLCLHYEQTARFLENAPRDRLITDVCSGKSKLVRIANRRKLRFVGGHPMAGNEFHGEKGWREDLFLNAPYFLTPGKNAPKQDVASIKRFACYLEAQPKVIDAGLHDRFVALTSHFPAFLSMLLKELANNTPPELRGPGFHSMTRLANTPPQLLQTFLQSNGTNIIQAASQFERRLTRFISNAKAQKRKG